MDEPRSEYLMEDSEEMIRLDLKTDPQVVRTHARWAGIRPGMRVADLGCGSGKTTHCLNELVQPGGEALGIDIAPQRIDFAREKYRSDHLSFRCGDIRHRLDHLGRFDFVWVRFVLEYYRSQAFDIVGNVSRLLKPGGILCLIDLDHNGMNHYQLPKLLENAMSGMMATIEEKLDFDFFAGRKLYSYLYDMCFQQIEVRVDAHHLIYGPLKSADAFNWRKKIEVAIRNSGYAFEEFGDGFEGFRKKFEEFFTDPRRFTYTPAMVCRGVRPGEGNDQKAMPP